MGYFVYRVNRELLPTFASKREGSAVSFLYDQEGNRKYLTREERRAFMDAAGRVTPEVRAFCMILAYTGARISEVLALTPARFDFAARNRRDRDAQTASSWDVPGNTSAAGRL
jgi:integrase